MSEQQQAGRANTAAGHTHTQTKKEAFFPFFQLPSEIRNMIYREAITGVKIYTNFCPPVLKIYTNLCPPALTHVSRAIRTETLPIFYGENTFSLDIPPVSKTHPLLKFVEMWKCFDQHGGLQYTTDLCISYLSSFETPLASSGTNWHVGFQTYTAAAWAGADCWRIGDDDIDWGDKKAVGREVRRAMTDTSRLSMPEEENLRDLVSPDILKKAIADIARVLGQVAALRPGAVKFVNLNWEFEKDGYDSDSEDCDSDCDEECPRCGWTLDLL